MQFACYKGKSGISKAIRFITRSEYSHIALMLNGSVIEAWDDGVRRVEDLSEFHTPGTEVDIFGFKEPLTGAQEEAAVRFLEKQLGQPYDWTSVFRFVTRRPGSLEPGWFCSELAFQMTVEIKRQLFNQTEAWQVPPDWIPRSTELVFLRSLVTV